MRTAFINICLRDDAKRRIIPVGLAYVLSAVKRAGMEFDLIDMDIEQMPMGELEAILAREHYDAIGLGCIVTGFRRVREIAALAKRIHPEAVFFAGNSVATSIPETLLRNTDVDYAVIGEGDVTVVELLRALEQGRNPDDVAGLAFLRKDRIHQTDERPLVRDLDDLPYPDWSIFDLDAYHDYSLINVNVFNKAVSKSFPVSTARGCPHNCTFCYHVFKGKKYRRYSDDAIVVEMRRLHDDYGANYFAFWDELSFPTKKSIRGLLDRLEALEFSCGWDAPIRAGLLTRDDLELIRDMRDSGCDNVSFSLENADETILAAMNKNISVSQFEEQAHVLHKGGVTPLTSVIFGYPQETPESIRKTIEVCERCDIYPSVGFLLPLPGTPIYQWARKHGYIPDEVEYLSRIGDRQDFHINLTGMEDKEFVDTVTEALSGLAERQGLSFESPFKTGTYQTPKIKRGEDSST